MPPLGRLILALALAVSPAAHAGGSSAAWVALGIWTSLLPRPPAPEVSPHHLRADGPPAPAKDSCTFVAGVRHCPLPKVGAQPR